MDALVPRESDEWKDATIEESESKSLLLWLMMVLYVQGAINESHWWNGGEWNLHGK